MELLSPAGSYSALTAAAENGADAIYMGGSLFNARLNAANFDTAEMIDALDFCRIRGIKSYITMNTLVHDRDLRSAVDYAAFLYEHGADALITQDLGLFSLLKKYIPDFEIHASTQMCISTLDGVRECEKLGFDRVVLSRELSMEDIRYIHNNTDMPLEVFVHGAMCMSFSGGCLFSSMVGARSGNCGTCAQPCRKYAAIDRTPTENDLALSLSDLCMIDHMDALKNSGVCSLKIEGRMKKPEYIASVTHAYRRAIDGASRDEIQELKREMYEVFNRGAFRTGYYFGDGAETDRIATAAPSQATLGIIHSRKPYVKNIDITMRLIAHPGENAKLYVQSDFAEFETEGAAVQISEKPITASTIERYTAQISKLGGTIFTAHDITAEVSGFIPISAVNDLRRTAVSKLEAALKLRRPAPQIPNNINIPAYKDTIVDDKSIGAEAVTFNINARITDMEQAIAAIDAGASELTIEYGMFSTSDIAALQVFRNKLKLNIALPITLIGKSEHDKLCADINPNAFDGIEINNIGQLSFARGFSHIIGGMHLNVFNAHCAKLLLDLGLDCVTLSPELNMPQIREICKFIPDSVLNTQIYGRIVLMNLFHCPVKEHIGCKSCGGKWHKLYDADGRCFPIKGMINKGSCVPVRLYNCFALDAMPRLQDLPLRNIVLSFTNEAADIVKNRLNTAISGGGDALPDTTRGYFGR